MKRITMNRETKEPRASITEQNYLAARAFGKRGGGGGGVGGRKKALLQQPR